MTPATLREAAALIESLTAERDALAEQVRVMREALEGSKVHVEHVADLDTRPHQVDWEASVALRLLEVALALTPTDAETQAKANAEKAAEYDKLMLEFEQHPSFQLIAAEAERDYFMARVEANAEAAQAFDRLAEACGVETSEGGHGFPIADVLQAALENLARRRGEAEENAEKAELLDWLDHTRPSLSFGYSPEYPLGAWGIYWTNAQTKQVEEAEAERLPDAIRAAREASYE